MSPCFKDEFNSNIIIKGCRCGRFSARNHFKLNPSCWCPGLSLSLFLCVCASLSLPSSPELFFLSRRVLHSTAQAERSRQSAALYAAANADSISLRDFASTTPGSLSLSPRRNTSLPRTHAWLGLHTMVVT